MKLLAVDIEAGVQMGGSSSRNLQLCRALLARGVDLRLLLTQHSDDPVEEAKALPRERLFGIRSWNRRYHLPRPEWRRIAAHVAWADVVYFPTYLWGAAPLAWLALRGRNKPWVVCPAGALPFFGRSLLIKHACQMLFGRAMLRDAAALVAVSEPEGVALQRYAGHPDSVVHIPNGVHEDGSDAEPGSPWHAAYLLFLGRLDPIKGPDLLLEAYARVLSARGDCPDLVIVGDGTLRLRLQHRAEAAGIARRVHFAGWAEERCKRRWLRHARFTVIPSRRDAMTLVALEAAVAGRPLLITRQCGFREVAESGGGLEVEAEVAALAGGIERMLDASPRWDEMGASLLRLARTSYSWDSAAARYQSLFERVAALG